jgi:hypothetical protein
LDYVPLDKDHLNVYSLKLITIILETGPEILNSFDLASFPTTYPLPTTYDAFKEDSAALLEKEKELRACNRSLTFKDYYDYLTKVIDLKNATITVQNLESQIKIFEKPNPEWWETYNELKHDNYNHLKKATLENALKIVGALFWLIREYSEWFSIPLDPHNVELYFSSELFDVASVGMYRLEDF